MTVLLTSGNPLGLRALGSGGRTATASYEQIVRTLRQSLGPDHAALFAEPSWRATTIDWFTALDSDGKPERLVEAPAALQQISLARLETIIRDIEAKAVSLKKSDRQDERILGDMMAHALEIPDENAVFLVGDHPVMTFWGYVRDQGRPAVSPIHALLLRRSSDSCATDPSSKASPTDDLRSYSASTAPIAAGAPVQASRWIVPAILWTIFSLLLLTCGVELLRGCAIGLPHNLTGWLLNYCASSSDASTKEALAAERSQQEQFRAEYDELVRQASLKRQACLIRAGKDPDTPKPVIASPLKPVIPDNKLRIPPNKTDSLEFLEGCWRAHEGLTENVGGEDTGKKLNITYCFNKDGSGSQTIRFEEDGAKCSGPAQAYFADETLTVDLGDAKCEDPHGSFRPAVDRCKSGDGGIAICDETPEGETKPFFKDFPFTRTTEEP